MPTLDWIGKQAVVNHHQEVPYHLLRDVPELGCGPADAGNLIVEGDNLTALKALLPYYAGQVKCIYIDPPYNTGNEGWVYNDNVNSPEINAWLGKVVGKEAEDLSRHDKWLCMMYPRLKLLREFLREDGTIFVSLDDNEVQSLRFIMDEIFGRKNFVASTIWQKKYARQNDSQSFSISHDYTVVYARESAKFAPNHILRTEAQTKGYKNLDKDPRGPWQSVVYTCAKTRTERPNLYYPIKNPFTGKPVLPDETRVWGCDSNATQVNVAENRLWWGIKGELEKPRKKVFLSEVGTGVVPDTLWLRSEVGDNQDARREIVEIFGSPDFPTPKPVRLIERILQIATNPGDLVLDSFAGSGTTGHAVLKLNAAESGKQARRFILAEIDTGIARTITAERVKRVAIGYTKAENEKGEGLGGGFRYVQLGDPLFDAAGKIKSTVRFRALARHVFFTETGTPLPHDAPCDKPLLGVAHGTGVYLLYNGILKDKSVDGGNVLTQPILDSLPQHDGPKVIYAASNRVSPSRLKARGITFKQTPYAIKVR